ncbi:mandelate racemase/muconate lactonizing enzyme family protein [Bordetella petrii]|uniref:mandelate racemase/muconate lactonizing enzyme family protein n=1 Tax=Bordetella petrii TaxID=94624 RepID=UPI001E547D19|nr:mandelate racemase/muconate lactonizing enzyme family protein [Bordetella petrii]MCD0503782.1 mandelate racemase/muconate lactonizing enzyme family protein [Bordetella petrii]
MTIEKVECWVFRAPIEQPVSAAVGSMTNRPAVFLRISADDGAWGWGEVFCNFPTVGAEHRARIVLDIIAPLIEGTPSNQPAATWHQLTQRLRRMALQAGEPGPLAQAIAGVDQALWDMQARRAAQPLWRLLAADMPQAGNRVRLYASGLGPDRAAETALAKQAQGFTAFKFKVGFHPDKDLDDFASMRAALGPRAQIMIDANQAWEPGTAARRIAALEHYDPFWIEEPLAADEPLSVWRELAGSTSVPLAAGENIREHVNFEAAIGNGHLRFIQPDVAKWGGITGCLAVARHAQQAGLVFCPHWLGGGVGLAASMHLRAALGPEGLVEVDANPNPLREQVCVPGRLEEGWLSLPDTPGIGVEPDLATLSEYRVELG